MYLKSPALRTPGRRKQARDLTPTEAAEIKQAFDLFDTDRSGKVYYRELKVLHFRSWALSQAIQHVLNRCYHPCVANNIDGLHD